MTHFWGYIGLAAATAERVVAGGKTSEVAPARISEAGRRALEDWST
jgi:hypothetical protein